jgi:HEAT repeat protein
MTRLPIRICSVVALLLAAVLAPAQAQTHASESTLSPQVFFESLVRNYDPANPPEFDSLLKVQHEIEEMPSGEVAQAMPSIFAALSHRDDNVKTLAVAALFSIALRSDSATLLNSHIDAIGALLGMPSPRLQGSAVHILSMQRPRPGPEIVPLLLGFLAQTDRDPIAHADAVLALLQVAPANKDVLSEAYKFVSQQSDPSGKEAALNAIANSKTEDARLTNAVIAALSDTNQEVRFTAAQALWRMPGDVVARAQPALQRLIEKPDEAQEVKAAATEAMKVINQQK